MKEARNQAETDLIALETEKSSLLGFVNPVKSSCLVGFVDHAKSDSPFKNRYLKGHKEKRKTERHL